MDTTAQHVKLVRRYVVFYPDPSFIITRSVTGLVCIYVITIVADECRIHPCANGGSCSLDEDYNKQCECTPTFDGDNCELGMRDIFYMENIGYNEFYLLQCAITITMYVISI